MSPLESDGLSVTYASDCTRAPDLRLLHYNDVYHVEYEWPNDPSITRPPTTSKLVVIYVFLYTDN